MSSHYSFYAIHRIADVPSLIVRGEDPWFALSSFFHDWWCYALDRREDLISTPPPLGETEEQKRWAVFCAATVEELCNRVSFPHPLWIYQPEYTLSSPWILSSNPYATLEPFARRNIVVERSVLDNKYEFRDAHETKPRWSVWSDKDLEVFQRGRETHPSVFEER